MRYLFLAALLVCPLLARVAQAGIIIVGQTRSDIASVSGSLGPVPGANDSHTAPDANPWNDTTQVSTQGDGGSASASQNSTLGPNAITALGALRAQQPAAAGTGRASADAMLDIHFTVGEAFTFRLFGSATPAPNPMSSNPFTPAPDYAYLKDLNGNILAAGGGGSQNLSGTSTGNFDISGSLVPGEYEFVMDMGAHHSGFSSRPEGEESRNYDVTLAVTTPEPTSVVGALSLLTWIFLSRRSRTCRVGAQYA